MVGNVGDAVVDATWFREHGWVVVPARDPGAAARLREWVEEVQSWGDDGGWFHHYEMTASGPRRCRTENFGPFHREFGAMLASGAMLDVASALLGEQAVLYKEKINYKLAGGAGWNPHQDAPAYPFIEAHVSCMIAVDDSNESNGCLEVVSGMHHELIPTDERGCIPNDVAKDLPWLAVPLAAGDALWFHSRTPHRSGDNRSASDRRAVYPTYNARREGDLREAYYSRRREELARASHDGRALISLIDDFRGVPVTP